MPIVVCALAASREIYSVGMDAPVEAMGKKWDRALSNTIAPKIVETAPCQEMVMQGDDLLGEYNGLDALPIPISTPGFDSAPTLSATNVISLDPETGVQNMGTYRAGLKAPDRLVVRMATRTGGAGGPINVVKGVTVDLLVPAEAELVIEGVIDPQIVEPEGPFGESHGHIALEEYNMPMEVTAITHKHNPIIPFYIGQVTPSESSVIKRVAYEPLFLSHLRNTLAIQSVKKVSLHEPLTSQLRVTIVTMERSAAKTEVWRALYGAASFKGDCSKITIAVNDDIDPDNADAILWALAYRHSPAEDVVILPHRGMGHGPKREHGVEEDSTMLIDATMKSEMPPLALPGKEYMEKAKALWERLGLPELRPESPWHGYSLGDWNDDWTEAAARAACGDYLENGRLTLARQQQDLVPETSVRDIEDGWD